MVSSLANYHCKTAKGGVFMVKIHLRYKLRRAASRSSPSRKFLLNSPRSTANIRARFGESRHETHASLQRIAPDSHRADGDFDRVGPFPARSRWPHLH